MARLTLELTDVRVKVLLDALNNLVWGALPPTHPERVAAEGLKSIFEIMARGEKCMHCGSGKHEHERVTGVGLKCRTRLHDTVYTPWVASLTVEEGRDESFALGGAERAFTDNYGCPTCNAQKGEPCVGARLHRQRKMQDPKYNEAERTKSAARQRHRGGE